jgi:hypothetical protein
VPKTPDKPDVNTGNAEKSISERFSNMVQIFATWLSDNKGRIFFWSLIVMAFGAILFRIRKKWMPKILVPFYRLRKEDWKSFEQGYHRLLKQLALYGIERREGQTLGTYSKYVDSFFGCADMKTLTELMKRVLQWEIESHEWGERGESWENLINLTSG